MRVVAVLFLIAVVLTAGCVAEMDANETGNQSTSPPQPAVTDDEFDDHLDEALAELELTRDT